MLMGGDSHALDCDPGRPFPFGLQLFVEVLLWQEEK